MLRARHGGCVALIPSTAKPASPLPRKSGLGREQALTQQQNLRGQARSYRCVIFNQASTVNYPTRRFV